MYINNVKDYLLQYAPKEILIQSRNGVIYHKGHKLRSDFLIDLLNSFYLKYLITEKDIITLKLNSAILKRKYHNYKPYLNYLIQNGYLSLHRNHFAGKKSKEYKLNIKKVETSQFVEYKNYDSSKNKRLLKFYNDPKNFLNQNFIIDESVLSYTIDNLRHVTIDYKKSISFLKDVFRTCEKKKYLKNYDSIERIHLNQIYITPDKYGRIHTNFTILKKEIRNKYLKIEGQPIIEIDIKNSQPFFLLDLIRDNLHQINVNTDELSIYYEHVTNGSFYEYLQKQVQENDRDRIKHQVYLELFNKPYYQSILLAKVFPSISQFIKVYKLRNGYKTISHQLQNFESDFIFNKVCKELIDEDIVFFTVHDSICVKQSDQETTRQIFDKVFNDYLAEVSNALFNI